MLTIICFCVMYRSSPPTCTFYALFFFPPIQFFRVPFFPPTGRLACYQGYICALYCVVFNISSSAMLLLVRALPIIRLPLDTCRSFSECTPLPPVLLFFTLTILFALYFGHMSDPILLFLLEVGGRTPLSTFRYGVSGPSPFRRELQLMQLFFHPIYPALLVCFCHLLTLGDVKLWLGLASLIPHFFPTLGLSPSRPTLKSLP